MFDSHLKDIIQFNDLDKKKRMAVICNKLEGIGLKPTKQLFTSCFGEGTNVFAKIGNTYQKHIIISAHYDGESLFDNAGGVITLLNIANFLPQKKPNYSIIILFTDQEETYQQGAANFLKYFPKMNILKHINLDGFGLGDKIFNTLELITNTFFHENLFLCDSDEFLKNGIPSISFFSAFEKDFLEAKKNRNVYLSFKKYKSDSFFKIKYSKEVYENLFKKLCNLH